MDPEIQPDEEKLEEQKELGTPENLQKFLIDLMIQKHLK